MPTYEVGSWNDKNAKFNGQTTNKRDLPQRDVKPFERVSQFTVNHSSFTPKEAQRVKANP